MVKSRHCLTTVTLLLLVGCGSQRDSSWKETFPVHGEVVVDGKPTAGVQVQLHDVKGVDTKSPTLTTALTDEQGKFAFSTYQQSDGVPAGDYVATFFWGDLNILKNEYGPDKLKNRYNDPKKSKFNISVGKEKAVDMGRVELTTK